ncbi:MAG: DUF6261 family protein, partial [Puniceicoccales bacterium]|jgi:hypothetical protein|nr:DUF6261 family protein [Puniceicoccales bacterium]
LQLLGLTTWVSELEANNLAYRNLKVQRYAEESGRPAQKVPKTRLLLDASYESIVRQLEVYGVLQSEDANWIELVSEMNRRVDYYHRLLAQRDGISAARKAGKEAISSSSFSSSSESKAA